MSKVTANVAGRIFGTSHYAASTVVAVLYAILWLVTGRAHAAPTMPDAPPEVFVIAQRVAPTIAPAQESANYVSAAILDEIVVVGHRESLSSNSRSIASVNNIATFKPWLSKVSHWIGGALLK